jgi:propanol-preferring alcohol dehydrogenase
MLIPIFETVLFGLTIIGSIVGTRQDLTEVFELHKAGRTKVIGVGRKLDEINACFDEVLAGKVPARLVLEF